MKSDPTTVYKIILVNEKDKVSSFYLQKNGHSFDVYSNKHTFIELIQKIKFHVYFHCTESSDKQSNTHKTRETIIQEFLR